MKTITYNPETHVLVPREPGLDITEPGWEAVDWEDIRSPSQLYLVWKAMLAAAPQPEPNHNRCAGCSPDNCSGCGAEPVDSEPAMWVMKHIRSGDLAQAKPNQKALHPRMWSQEHLYTTPQPDRVTTKESYVELDIHSNPSRTEQQRKLDGSLEVGQLLGNGQNQETSHSKTVGDILLADAFRGDTANLIESIVALVSLDRAGVLVPHGIGGHARSLLESAAIRLSQPDRTAELEAALKVARDGIDKFLVAKNSTEFDCACDLSVGYLCGPCHADKQQQQLLESALAKINEVLKP